MLWIGKHGTDSVDVDSARRGPSRQPPESMALPKRCGSGHSKRNFGSGLAFGLVS